MTGPFDDILSNARTIQFRMFFWLSPFDYFSYACVTAEPRKYVKRPWAGICACRSWDGVREAIGISDVNAGVDGKGALVTSFRAFDSTLIATRQAAFSGR